MKTAEQSEQDRAAAREALRRHRARRKAEKDALPRWQTRAVDDVNAVLRDVLYSGSSEVQTRDRTQDLAAALFDTLGPEGAVRLAARLGEEIDAGGTRAQRRLELAARQVETSGEVQTFREKSIEIETIIPEAPRVLDRQRPYAEVHGDTHGRAYEQDGHYFRADGREAGRG